MVRGLTQTRCGFPPLSHGIDTHLPHLRRQLLPGVTLYQWKHVAGQSGGQGNGFILNLEWNGSLPSSRRDLTAWLHKPGKRFYSITQRFICSLWSSWRVLHYQQGPSWAHVDRFWPSRSLVWSLILEDAFRRPMSAALSWDWPVTSPPVKCAFSFFIDLRWGQVLLMFKEISNVTGCCSMSPSFMSSVKHPQKAKVLSSSPTGEEAQCDCVCPSGSTSFLSRIIRLLVFVDTTLWRNIGNVFAIEWIFIAI